MTPEVQVHPVAGGEANHSSANLPLVVAWDDDVQLQAPNTHLASPGAGGSVGSASDVKDLGDGKRLEDQTEQEQFHQAVFRKRSTGKLVSNAGAGFENFDVPDHLDGDDIATSPDALSAPAAAVHDLGKEIRRAFHHRWDKVSFLPRNELERIITHDMVSKELAKVGVVPSADSDQLERMTCQIMDLQKLSNWSTSRRKIFAILTLIERVETIKDFIEDGIFDIHLPFTYSRTTDTWEGKDEHGICTPINVFKSWKPHECEGFAFQQPKIHVPIFNLATKAAPKVKRFKLAEETVLPWIEKPQLLGRGGFGAVVKVKIHPHHLRPKSNEDAYYAVKHIEKSSDRAIPTEREDPIDREFKDELKNLNRFAEKEHPHLIRPLCAFSVGTEHHIMFPCADGNLLELWKKSPEPQASKHDGARALWLCRQCQGLAEGLLTIHRHETGNIPGSYLTSEITKKHGRHGDLKPENILWFKDQTSEEGGDNTVMLKITDFGLMRFHGTMSMYNDDAASLAISRTYRAPEYNIKNEVSQAYDIWSLGCVLLEFVTWYLTGWKGVEDFSTSRMGEDQQSFIYEDIFFSYDNKDATSREPVASAKKSVTKHFAHLHGHPSCPDFIHELLWFIEDKLLRMAPEKRAKCPEIYKKFNELREKCEKDLDYCLEPTKRQPLRTGTNDSQLCHKPPRGPSDVFRHSMKRPPPNDWTEPPRNAPGYSPATRPQSPLRTEHSRGDTQEDENADVESQPVKLHHEEIFKNEETQGGTTEVFSHQAAVGSLIRTASPRPTSMPNIQDCFTNGVYTGTAGWTASAAHVKTAFECDLG
ncbi:hypothetical protein QQX98_002521 [Neonectria punicea]|uniref:Protein kinase domain-containing protein n=1 Tax=Neonectria punicea TaxID=979145 RepID=A0ABR1HIP7_9HYPO